MNLLLSKIQHKVQGNKQLYFNLAWLIGDKVIRLGIGIVITALVARYLGPASFGLFNFAFAFVWIFENVVTLGLNEIMLRDLVQYPAYRLEIMGSGFLLKTIGSAIAFLIITGIITLLRLGDVTTQMLVIIMSFSMIIKNAGVIKLWFESQVQSKYIVIAELIAFVAAAAVRLYLIYYKFPLLYFAWATVVESIISSCAFGIVYYIRLGSFTHWQVSFRRAKQLLRESWPIIFSAVSAMIYLRVDQILLKLLSGDKEAGVYSVAARLSEIWYFIPSSIIITLFPKILKSKVSKRTLYDRGLQQMFDLLTLLCLSVALIMTFLATPLISLIFGDAYAASAPVLAVHIWGGTFMILYVSSSKHLIAEGMQKIDLFRTVVGAILNIAFNLVLIPKYGAIGSAWATVASYAISIFSLGIFKRCRKTFFMMLYSFNPSRLYRSFLLGPQKL